MTCPLCGEETCPWAGRRPVVEAVSAHLSRCFMGNAEEIQAHHQLVADAKAIGSKEGRDRLLALVLRLDEIEDAGYRAHLPGCGIEVRGCAPGCWNHDPRFDGGGT